MIWHQVTTLSLMLKPLSTLVYSTLCFYFFESCVMSSIKPLSKMHQRLQAKAEERTALGDTFPKQTNTFWDDARALYEQSLDAINVTHGQLAHFLSYVIQDPARMALIKDPVTLVNNINVLARDINEHSNRLNAIFAKHSDRSGTTVSPDDTMLVIKLNGEYADALEVYQAVMMPTVAHIFEQIGAIEELLANEQATQAASAAAALADVNVVSDAVIKTEEASHA